MENAAKALTIAGGVLIAIIVIATLWYSFQQWGILPQAKADNEKISQEVEFNKEFESYNKQNLYGTDVITVLNKAMASNEKYGITYDPSDPYFIDVQFILESDVTGYTKTYERTKDNPYPPEPIPVYDSKPTLIGGFTYALSDIKQYITLSQIVKDGAVKVTETKKGTTYVRVEKYSKGEDFKLRYFTCTEMVKHPSSGRICKIVFKEFHVTDDMKI